MIAEDNAAAGDASPTEGGHVRIPLLGTVQLPGPNGANLQRLEEERLRRTAGGNISTPTQGGIFAQGNNTGNPDTDLTVSPIASVFNPS